MGTTAVVHFVSGDLWGGAENQVYQLAKQQTEREGLKVCVVILNRGQLYDRLSESKVEVLLCDESKESFFKILSDALSFVKAIKREYGDVILHSHRRKENLLAALVALRQRLKVVRTMHGADEHVTTENLRKRAAKRLELYLYKFLISRHVAVAAHLESDLSRCGYRGRSITTIPNGIDFDKLEGDTGASDANPLTASLLPCSGGKAWRVGIVGRLVPVKRHDLFIQLASRTFSAREEIVQFFIIGDGPMLETTKTMAGSSPASARIHFLGFRSDVNRIIKELDAVFILSDHEGLPLNLLESIGLGVPVFGHDVGGVGEILRPYPALLLKAPLLPSAEKAIQDLLTDDSNLKQQFLSCRQAIVERFSLARCEQAYFELYVSCLNPLTTKSS
ncbi:MAG: hypothetical protein CME36_09280 [unclassified Hahellaceae]|nr:hypothetical protein [Hahellaceae bacterium]